MAPHNLIEALLERAYMQRPVQLYGSRDVIQWTAWVLPFYQFTQPSVAVSPFSGNLVDFFDSFSVRFLRGQGPQNATHGDRDSLPTGPPPARAGDPTGPSPAVRRPPRPLSTATARAQPH